MSVLDDVFRSVSDNFVYESDLAAWGCIDYWATPKEMAAHAGPDGKVHDDCDGFALLCRGKLDEMGIENRLVFCQVETGEYHLVCESTGYILDCRHMSVMPRQILDYKWISISGHKPGEPWHLITQP